MKSILYFISLLFLQTPTYTQSTGFFHVEQVDGKWQVIDPDGHIFHMRGIAHYGDGTHMPWNLKEKYGSLENWRRSVKEAHIEMGFTYLPPSVGPSAIDPSTIGDRPRDRANLITRTPEWKASEFAALDYPFTAFLEVPLQYMAGDGLPDVFGEGFSTAVDQRCREFVEPLRDNRQLIGYHFAQNPPWNINSDNAERWIEACTKPNSAGLKEWAKLMEEVYGTIERWRQTYGTPIKEWSDIEKLERPLRGYISGDRLREDKETFLKRICERWYKVYHNTIRKYDQNHMILGDRNTLHLQDTPPSWSFFIMEKYIDVLSVNTEGPPSTTYGVLEAATRNWNGPILLADTGAGIYYGDPPKSTYQARNIAEYEEVYSGLVKMSMEHPQIIGFGWCGYYESPHPGGRSGLMEVKDESLVPNLVPIVKKWNSKMADFVEKQNDNREKSKK